MSANCSKAVGRSFLGAARPGPSPQNLLLHKGFCYSETPGEYPDRAGSGGVPRRGPETDSTRDAGTAPGRRSGAPAESRQVALPPPRCPRVSDSARRARLIAVVTASPPMGLGAGHPWRPRTRPSRGAAVPSGLDGALACLCRLDPGEPLSERLLTDRATLHDIPRWARCRGHRLVGPVAERRAAHRPGGTRARMAACSI
jgi:hypothetical protein